VVVAKHSAEPLAPFNRSDRLVHTRQDPTYEVLDQRIAIVWIQNELRMSDAVKKQVRDAVDCAHCLKICYDLANGTKHHALTSPKLGDRHLLTDIRITPGEETKVDCVIELPDGSCLSARKLARECLLEWERILQVCKLPIEGIS